MVEYTVQSSIPPKYHRGRRGQGLSALSSYCTNHFSGNKIPADDERPIISKKNIDFNLTLSRALPFWIKGLRGDTVPIYSRCIADEAPGAATRFCKVYKVSVGLQDRPGRVVCCIQQFLTDHREIFFLIWCRIRRFFRRILILIKINTYAVPYNYSYPYRIIVYR